MKKLFALSLLLLVLSSMTIPAEASHHNTGALQAGHRLAEIMELIITRYVGDPITLEALTEAALRGMADILDQYSSYMSPDELEQFIDSLSTRQMIGIGIGLAVSEEGITKILRVIPNSPAQNAGLLPGDIIISIDGENVEDLPMEAIFSLITNPDNSRILIGIDRMGIPFNFDIQKGEVSFPSVTVESLKNLQEDYGLNYLEFFRHIRINTMGYNASNYVRQALSQMKAEGVEGIILDLRGNAGGYLHVTIDIANQLVPQGVVFQTIDRAGRIRTYSSLLAEAPFDNIVVLVDRFTASAAEVIASALQDSNAAVIVGETTFGKGSIQSIYTLNIGGALILTTGEYFRRSGEAINGIGVIPCIFVQQSQDPMDDIFLRRGLEVLIEQRN